MLGIEGRRFIPPDNCFGVIVVDDGRGEWHKVSPRIPYCLARHTTCEHFSTTCGNCPLIEGQAARLSYRPLGPLQMNDMYGYNLEGEGIEVVRK